MDFLVTLRWRLAVTLVETAEFVVFEGMKCSSGCSAQVSCKPQGCAQTSAS